MNSKKGSIWKLYGYAWVTLGFFLISLAGHWLFGWFAYVSEQQALSQPVEASGYAIEMMRTRWRTGSPSSCNCSGRWAGLRFCSMSGLLNPRRGMTALRPRSMRSCASWTRRMVNASSRPSMRNIPAGTRMPAMPIAEVG